MREDDGRDVVMDELQATGLADCARKRGNHILHEFSPAAMVVLDTAVSRWPSPLHS